MSYRSTVLEGISLVIFDCDGVLVDSELISNRVLADAMCKIGLRTSAKDAKVRFAGLTLANIVASVEGEIGRSLPPGWLQEFERARAEAFKTELREIPGALETVRLILRRGVAICAASQARVEKSILTLGLTGLLPYFEGKIFSSSMVPRPKPYPDLFLHAASQLRHEPKSCVVIEDTTSGLHAARAAGMRAYLYSKDADEATLREGGVNTFADMRKLPELLFA